MEGVKIKNIGNNNIANNGTIYGDCITGTKNIIIIYKMNKYTEEAFNKLSETVNALNDIARSQLNISEAILKQRDNDNKNNDAIVLLAKAAENNSIANINLSQSILEDKKTINKLIEILETFKKQ